MIGILNKLNIGSIFNNKNTQPSPTPNPGFLVPPPPRQKTPNDLPLFFPACTRQMDRFLRIVHGQKEGQQRGKIPGIRKAYRLWRWKHDRFGTLVMVLSLEIVGTYPFGPNCVRSKSSYEDLKQMFTPSPTTPYLASRQTSTQTMARSAVEESSMTPMSPFPKPRLIAIPQGRWRWRSRRERKKRGRFYLKLK